MSIRQILLDQAIQQVKAAGGPVSFGDVEAALAHLPNFDLRNDDEFHQALLRNAVQEQAQVQEPSYVSDVLLAPAENLPSFHAADLKGAELRAKIQRLHQQLQKERTALAVAHDAYQSGGVKPDPNEAVRDFANSEFKYRQDVAAGKVPGKYINKQGQVVSETGPALANSVIDRQAYYEQGGRGGRGGYNFRRGGRHVSEKGTRVLPSVK